MVTRVCEFKIKFIKKGQIYNIFILLHFFRYGRYLEKKLMKNKIWLKLIIKFAIFLDFASFDTKIADFTKMINFRR